MTTFIEKGVIRPPNPDSPSEVIRMMPRGVRDVRDVLITTAPVGEWPATIREWCSRHGLIHESTRRGYTGRLTRTQLGDKVTRQLNQRMKGYTP